MRGADRGLVRTHPAWRGRQLAAPTALSTASVCLITRGACLSRPQRNRSSGNTTGVSKGLPVPGEMATQRHNPGMRPVFAGRCGDFCVQVCSIPRSWMALAIVC
jgi:hypothetical protein